MKSNTDKKPAQDRRWSRRLSLLWYLAGVLLVGYGLLVLLPGDSNIDHRITGEVLPDLTATDRVAAEPGALRDWNLLLITIETTRADHLACYGNRGVATPVLDQLARDGVLFSQAITPVPATLPAHSSMMTGLYPYNHGARANGTFRLTDDKQTLAEMLKAQGYRTGAAISAFVLDGQYGLDQGFDDFADDLTKGIKHSPQMFRERPAELTNEPVFEWLEQNGQERFFYWVHYFDPHAVYLPPEPFRTQYAHHLYNGEIAYVDAQIGKLLDHLRDLGVVERTLVIVTSDHGEGLGEHGEQTHSLLVYDSTMRVPLIISAPGAIDAGHVVDRQVSLVDLAPTILQLLDVPSEIEFDGQSLLAEPAPGPRSVYIETLSTMTLHGWAPLLGVRRDDFKFILAPEPEIYDLRSDPRETQNLFKTRVETAADLQQELIGFLGEDPWLSARAQQNLPLDPEAVRHLRALGYVASAPEDDSDQAIEDLPDPKEMVHHWEKVQQGMSLRNEGDIEGAVAVLEACLAEVPRDIWAMQMLAGAYAMYGETERALALYEKVIELAPNELAAYMGMANCHVSRLELDKARAILERAAQIDPESGDVCVMQSFLAYCSRDEEQAVRLAERAIELDPGSSGPRAYNQLAMFHLNAGRIEEAQASFEKAIEIDAFNGNAHEGLARIYLRQDRRDDAKRELAIALQFVPAHPRALATSGGLLSDEGEIDKAIAMLEQALKMSPNFGPALNNLALVYRQQGKLDEAEAKYFAAIEHNPYFDLPYVNLGQLYLKQDKEEQAVEQFRKAVSVNRYNKVALANLAMHHLKAERLDQAYTLLVQAVRVDPDYALAHKYLGMVYRIRNKPARSLHHLRRSLQLDSDLPQADQVRRAIRQLESALPEEHKEKPASNPAEAT